MFFNFFFYFALGSFLRKGRFFSSIFLTGSRFREIFWICFHRLTISYKKSFFHYNFQNLKISFEILFFSYLKLLFFPGRCSRIFFFIKKKSVFIQKNEVKIIYLKCFGKLPIFIESFFIFQFWGNRRILNKVKILIDFFCMKLV